MRDIKFKCTCCEVIYIKRVFENKWFIKSSELECKNCLGNDFTFEITEDF